MKRPLKKYIAILLLTLLIPVPGQAVQALLKWGVYARAGASFFVNRYTYDKALYHFPPGLHYRAGSLMSWTPAPLHTLILETAIDHTRTGFTAVKYNNSWSTLTFRQFSIGAGLHYRAGIPGASRFWIQTGLQLQYRINPDAAAVTTSSRHGNNNNVREVLAAIYNGVPKRWETAIPLAAGRYLDKNKRHELSLFAEARISSIFRKGHEAFMRHQFTFSDGSTAAFSAQMNGISIPVGIRYACWF